MNCALQIFLNDAWLDCAQIEHEDNRWHWNHLVMYAVEHAEAPLSLAEPVDTDI
ncbi:MAG TPA: hypothetical protein VHC91_22505 [Trinickia sp.]|uniref:hypothetical protein n=1 Tax=Trinickia sp. TaxID=2571163 RepID=UPI002B6CE9E2|nr:hypothetical protein [Trinickia sp.]HVW53137.1 hypothetical protein [Trinickia sp.]